MFSYSILRSAVIYSPLSSLLSLYFSLLSSLPSLYSLLFTYFLFLTIILIKKEKRGRR